MLNTKWRIIIGVMFTAGGISFFFRGSSMMAIIWLVVAAVYFFDAIKKIRNHEDESIA